MPLGLFMTEVTHPLFLQILPHLLELAEVLQPHEDTAMQVLQMGSERWGAADATSSQAQPRAAPVELCPQAAGCPSQLGVAARQRGHAWPGHRRR